MRIPKEYQKWLRFASLTKEGDAMRAFVTRVENAGGMDKFKKSYSLCSGFSGVLCRITIQRTIKLTLKTANRVDLF